MALTTVLEHGAAVAVAAAIPWATAEALETPQTAQAMAMSAPGMGQAEAVPSLRVPRGATGGDGTVGCVIIDEYA